MKTRRIKKYNFPDPVQMNVMEVSAEKISTSKICYEAIKDHFTVNISIQEQFLAVFLNRQNKIKNIISVSIGGISGTVVDILDYEGGTRLLCNRNNTCA